MKYQLSLLRTKSSIWYSSLSKIDKIAIVLGIISHTILFIIFFKIYSLEFVIKYIIPSGAIPVFITWFITHFYHKKNEPLHKFWNDKRQGTAKIIIEYIRTIRANLRVLERGINIERDFLNNIKSLVQFVSITNQYLTINELENINQSIIEYSNYFRNFNLRNKEQMEFHIINSQNALTELIISFKLKNKKEVTALIQPISKNITSDNITSTHNVSNFMIEQSLQIKIDY